MTSRERVRAVLNHRVPDKIPNGLGGCETTGLHLLTYDKLKKVLACDENNPTKLDTFMTNAVFEEPVIKAMGGDIILLASPNMCPSEFRGNVADQWKEQRLWGKTFAVPVNEKFTENEDGSIVWDSRGGAYCPKGGYYFDYKGSTDMHQDFGTPDPDKFNPRDTINENTLRSLEEQAKRIYEETDLSICLGESITDLQVAPGGMIGHMILMMEEPEIMKAFLEKCLNAALKQIKLLEQAVGKYVDILSIAHDFGDNRGVTIGDALWREIYKEHYTRLFTGWKSITNMKINLHSCGSIYGIMNDLIDCGVDIINPIQTSAANMSAEKLKEEFGDRVILWGGGYDGQLIDKAATYDQVYSAVTENLKVFGKGGNYIFSGVHNLPADMPEHHVKAMIDAFKDNRTY